MNQRSGNAERLVLACAAVASAVVKKWGLAPSPPKKAAATRHAARCLSPFFRVFLVVVLGMLLVTQAAGDDAVEHVWLLSTRRLPHSVCCVPLQAPIDYWRLDAQRCWQPADERSFLHGDDSRLPTTLFVHGNRDDFDDVVDDGWRLYRRLEPQAGGRPFRFVIWSWPADRIAGGVRRDVQVKASCSDVDAFYLAEVLHRTKGQTPLCLVGYSFGARLVSGALHLLGGGTLLGRSLAASADAPPTRTPLAPLGSAAEGDRSMFSAIVFSQNVFSRRKMDQSPPIRAVFVAAAMDCDWLLPGHRHGLALSQVDQMLITQNCCDRVLKWYPRMYRGRGQQALGRVGPAWGEIEKIELLDLTCSAGREHKWFNYLRTPALLSRLPDYALPHAEGSAFGVLGSGQQRQASPGCKPSSKPSRTLVPTLCVETN